MAGKGREGGRRRERKYREKEPLEADIKPLICQSGRLMKNWELKVRGRTERKKEREREREKVSVLWMGVVGWVSENEVGTDLCLPLTCLEQQCARGFYRTTLHRPSPRPCKSGAAATATVGHDG